MDIYDTCELPLKEGSLGSTTLNISSCHHHRHHRGHHHHHHHDQHDHQYHPHLSNTINTKRAAGKRSNGNSVFLQRGETDKRNIRIIFFFLKLSNMKDKKEREKVKWFPQRGRESETSETSAAF